MPAPKPKALHKSRSVKPQKPSTPLPVEPPPSLAGDAVARFTWRRVVRLFGSLDQQILTALDAPSLENFCRIESRLADIRGLRAKARRVLDDLLKAYDGAKEPEMKLRLLKAVRGATLDVAHADQSLNQTARLSLDYAKSLFLLPGSRGGINPPGEPAADPMAAELSRYGRLYAKNGGSHATSN